MSETMKYVRNGLLVGASTLVFLSQVSVAQDTAAETPPPANAEQKQPEIVQERAHRSEVRRSKAYMRNIFDPNDRHRLSPAIQF